MMRRLLDGHNALLLRSYFFLVAGLLLMAMLLDLGFRSLQSPATDDVDPWLRTSLSIIEAELAASGFADRAATLKRLEAATGLDLRVLPRDAVVSSRSSASGIETLVDDEGKRSYLFSAPALDGLIHVGPLQEKAPGLLSRLLTPLFYLSIFVVVGLWLRPLLKDLNHITLSAQRFAADYREPLATAANTTRLTSLAGSLDDMSLRLSGLIQSQKELIAALSHEMRTPLARIRFALAVIDSSDDPGLRTQLGALNDDVQEVEKLIGTMLSYARLDHPDLRMNWQEVPLLPWLRETADKWRHSDAQVTVGAGSEPDTINMDPRLMALALSNLLSNAVRHANGRVHCEVTRSDDMLVLVVEDDGRGIAEDKRADIFKAFTRLDNSRNRETGGCGLGLAIVARIASLHGGAVRVVRSPNLGGARFELSWPNRFGPGPY